MNILSLETSCDETSAAVVEETGDVARPWVIRSNVVASQAEVHREWGGVVPELASRQHLRDICGVVERALDDAKTAWADLGAIAVTQGPGLIGSLLGVISVFLAGSALLRGGAAVVARARLGGKSGARSRPASPTASISRTTIRPSARSNRPIRVMTASSTSASASGSGGVSI